MQRSTVAPPKGPHMWVDAASTHFHECKRVAHYIIMKCATARKPSQMLTSTVELMARDSSVRAAVALCIHNWQVSSYSCILLIYPNCCDLFYLPGFWTSFPLFSHIPSTYRQCLPLTVTAVSCRCFCIEEQLSLLSQLPQLWIICCLVSLQYF